MGKIVMGKDMSTLTQEEKDALMAEMRARRNGNGRKGYRSPDRKIISTNNFPDSSKDKKVGKFAKFANEHVKCVFVCLRELYSEKTAYRQTKIYLIGFLSDSNKYSFEEFRESPPKAAQNADGIKYRIDKYRQLFEKKNIDKDTTFVLCTDGLKDSDFMPVMINFMRGFSGCDFIRIKKAKILKKLIKEYHVFDDKKYLIFKDIKRKNSIIYNNCEKYKPALLNRLLYLVYEYMVDNKFCPWITTETKNLINELSMKKRHSHVLLELGLFYSVIVKFKRIQNKKPK